MDRIDLSSVITLIPVEINDQIIPMHMICANALYGLGFSPQDDPGEIVRQLTGFAASPWDITWYSAPVNSYDHKKGIAQAIREKNTIVICERLELLDRNGNTLEEEEPDF